MRAPAFACAIGGAALLAGGREALASAPVQFETSVDVHDLWVRQMPRLQLTAPSDTPLRTIPAATLPSTGSQQFLALGGDTAVVVRDRWIIPLGGMQFGWAIGSSPQVVTSIDGSIVSMRPWSSDEVTALLPGFGARFKERRWMFQVTLRPVVTVLWMNANVADGATSHDLNGDSNLFSATLGARVDFEACRRLDPLERACLFVAPALYEFAPLNGGSIGIRWELGP